MRHFSMLSSLTLFAALAISYAPAADAQYLYCWTANLRTGSDQMFFSRVFPGDVSQRGPMQIAFQKYVNENYQDSNPGPGACKNYSSRRDAESDLALDLKEKRDFEKQQVVETGWTFHADSSIHYWVCNLRFSEGGNVHFAVSSVFQRPARENGKYESRYAQDFINWFSRKHPGATSFVDQVCEHADTRNYPESWRQTIINTMTGTVQTDWAPK